MWIVKIKYCPSYNFEEVEINKSEATNHYYTFHTVIDKIMKDLYGFVGPRVLRPYLFQIKIVILDQNRIKSIKYIMRMYKNAWIQNFLRL